MLLLFACLLVNDAAWQWPIDPTFGVTATYGEYRGLRLHMGLDFSTGGVEGMKLKPAQGGTVYRVRAQGHGYGKAIYIEHPNKYVTVYAHLAAFGPKIAEAIKAKGYDPATEFGTLNLKTKISASDLLAYTGESGAGMPHLHFEVRKGENTPVDPLTLDFPKLPGNGGNPKLAGYYLEPLDGESRVNGLAIPFWAKQGVTSVQASGRIGLRIPAYIAGTRGSRLGCRAVKVSLDGEPIGSWKPRKISFEEYRRGGLIHDQAFSGFGPTQYAYCFDDRADMLPQLPGYERTQVAEITKRSTLEVAIMNLEGDWKTFSLTLDPDAPLLPGSAMPPPPVQATSLDMFAQGDRVYFQSQLKGTLQLPDTMMGLAPNKPESYKPQANKPPEVVVWRTKGGTLRRTVGALPQGKVWQYRVGPWKLKASGLGELPPIAVFLEPVDHKIMKDTIAYHSPVLHFGRPGMPTKGLTVAFEPEDGKPPEHLGIYAWSFTKRKWRHWGSLAQEDMVDLDYLTPMVVGEDLSPPVIGIPKLHRYFVGARTVIPLRDKGSGIDRKSLKVYRDGEPLNAKYDGDRGWIILPKGSGKGPWRVEVADRSGLQTKMNRLRRK